MPLPAFRNSRSKVRRRRSHHALKPITVNTCKCGADVLTHRACPKCGTYNGRQVKGGMQAVEKELTKKVAAPAAETATEAKPKKAVAKKKVAKKKAE